LRRRRESQSNCPGADQRHLFTNICSPIGHSTGATFMSKGMNQKKDTKKKPAKSMKEKRAEKQAKRQTKG